MTTGQRITLMSEWWPAACRAQGWPVNDRAFRLQKLSEFVGRPLASAKDLDNGKDIDAVKTNLLALTDDLQAAQETDDRTIGDARRIRHLIRTEIIPCLAVYLGPAALPSAISNLPSPEGQAAAEAYLQTVITGLARWNTTDRPTRPPTLDDLETKPTWSRRGPAHALRPGPSQIEQALLTLNARLHAKRREAGHSIHDMLKLAGLPCNCRRCADRTRPKVAVAVAAKPEEADCPF